ncbi:MAG: hypothetical protein KF881_11020 [Acidobacteria bacterium]|nr:hypothetical protein [Acidobacteriota bacterium]
MTRSDTSYPKSKIKILLLENIFNAAVREFGAGGHMEVQRLFSVPVLTSKTLYAIILIAMEDIINA